MLCGSIEPSGRLPQIVVWSVVVEEYIVSLCTCNRGTCGIGTCTCGIKQTLDTLWLNLVCSGR